MLPPSASGSTSRRWKLLDAMHWVLVHIQEAEACSLRRPFARLSQLLAGSNKGNRDSFDLIVSSDRCTRPGARGAQAPWHSA